MRSKRSEVADLFSVTIPILAQIAKNSEAEISAGPYNEFERLTQSHRRKPDQGSGEGDTKPAVLGT